MRPPAASVSVPEPTTSEPLRVTLRAPKSRPQAGPESVTVPSMVQVVAPQQPEDEARKGAALHALVEDAKRIVAAHPLLHLFFSRHLQVAI